MKTVKFEGKTVCTDLEFLDVMLTTGRVNIINWTKFVSIFDLKKQKQPVLIKDGENVNILYPPFFTDIKTKHEKVWKKGVNKMIDNRIVETIIRCQEVITVVE